jgi:hypothetical protein
MALGWAGIGWMLHTGVVIWPIFVFCALSTGVASVANLLSLLAYLRPTPEPSSSSASSERSS